MKNPVKAIRVLVASDTVANSLDSTISAEERKDFDFVECRPRALEVLMQVQVIQAHVVILESINNEEPGLVSHLIGEYPDLIILTIFPNGHSSITQRCPVRYAVATAATQKLLDELRRAIANPCFFSDSMANPPSE